MPVVNTEILVPDCGIERVWAVVRDFAGYPEKMEDILEVQILEESEKEAVTSWRVLLNGSELTWTERDYFDPFRSIAFEQIDGDLQVLRGAWTFEAGNSGTTVHLRFEFDLGIPSLADVLDPIGIQAVKANSRQMLLGIRAHSPADGAARLRG